MKWGEISFSYAIVDVNRILMELIKSRQSNFTKWKEEAKSPPNCLILRQSPKKERKSPKLHKRFRLPNKFSIELTISVMKWKLNVFFWFWKNRKGHAINSLVLVLINKIDLYFDKRFSPPPSSPLNKQNYMFF